MKFSIFSERALSVCSNNIEQAMEWLLAHVDDEIPAVAAVATGPSSTEPAEQTTEKSDESSSASGAEGSTLEAKSIKCEDCGRLFRFVFTLFINI